MKSLLWISLSVLLSFCNLVYGQEKSDSIAENMLLLQRNYGGWSKFFNKQKVDYKQVFGPTEIKLAEEQKGLEDATIDNNATTTEIRYLVKAYHETKNERYLQAARLGVRYLLKAQYANGGWPQYYPDKHLYRSQITFNDRAMINVLLIMQDIKNAKGGFEILSRYVDEAKAAIDKGIACILQTQISIDGKKTIWAAQYDKDTLQPAKARAYELPSLASSESSDILLFLMDQPSPVTAIKEAVEAGIHWFDIHAIRDQAVVLIDDARQASGKDRILQAKHGSLIWARFYDLKNQGPIFVGRDGEPHGNLTAIENERRVGYAWYGNWGDKVNKAYKKWKLNRL
jgi:PelA/Pel-15E family pectate lyase